MTYSADEEDGHGKREEESRQDTEGDASRNGKGLETDMSHIVKDYFTA